MNTKTIMELKEKRAALWEQTKAFLEEHRGEDGLVDAPYVEQYEKMTADVKALGGEIRRLEEQMEIEASLGTASRMPVQEKPVMGASIAPHRDDEQYARAFWNMVRGDYMPDLVNVLQVGKDTEGGYTVPDEFHRKLVEALDDNNIMRSLGHVMHTGSGIYKIPVATDTCEGVWFEEGEDIPETNTAFSQVTLSAFKVGAIIRVSNELLNDSAFDIASYVARRFGVAMGHAEEKAFIVGTGVKQPTGLMSDREGAEVGVTAAAQDRITFDDVYKLYYSLRAPYRSKAAFLCNEDIVLQLMLMKDGNGNYVWRPSLDVGKPDTVLGRPIHTSAYVPKVGAGAKVMAFGDFSYYWVADRTTRTFKRLNEAYARSDQVGFLTTQRVDGKLILPEAVKVLKMAGTGEQAAG